jgi:hypothetical protein
VRIKRSHQWKVRRTAKGWQHSQPQAHMMVGNARGWAAVLLGLPVEAVRLVHPDGRAARTEKRIGALRDEWFKE